MGVGNVSAKNEGGRIGDSIIEVGRTRSYENLQAKSWIFFCVC